MALIGWRGPGGVISASPRALPPAASTGFRKIAVEGCGFWES